MFLTITDNMHYRQRIKAPDLYRFTLKVKESNLLVCCYGDLSTRALNTLMKVRRELEDYLNKDPAFAKSLIPIKAREDAPSIVKVMEKAAFKAKVGPMAAVAGAIAEAVGRSLLEYSPEVIVENGGDIFLKTDKSRIISIYAGNSPLSMRLGIKIPSGEWGIATSSGTVGHSLSFGKADAAVVVSPSAPLSDALATALGNRIRTPQDIKGALEWIKGFEEVEGAVIIMGKHLGATGSIELVPL